MEHYGKGSIEGLSFTVNGVPAANEPHPNPDYVDILKLLLNKPLAPGDSIIIATPFTVKLPPYFSRSGYADGEYMVCQWYPKPAVFDKDGWHPMPYLDMGEFYSEYASFDVSITIPSDFVVGATGSLQNADELQAYKKAGAANTADRKGKRTLYLPTTGNSSKTLRYLAEQVPDFAWFADRNFVIQYDTTRLPGGRIIDVFSFLCRDISLHKIEDLIQCDKDAYWFVLQSCPLIDQHLMSLLDYGPVAAAQVFICAWLHANAGHYIDGDTQPAEKDIQFVDRIQVKDNPDDKESRQVHGVYQSNKQRRQDREY